MHADGGLGSASRICGAGKVLQVGCSDKAAQRIAIELNGHDQTFSVVMPDIMDIRLLDDKAAPNCEPEKPMERATLLDRTDLS